jgi:putative endonuclease
MMKGKLTKLALCAADAVLRGQNPGAGPSDEPAHLVRGREGEEAAYFYLRAQDYVIVARNFRSRRHRGEIDLIGWDRDVLCFIEVKTRRERTRVPAEMAVDGPKQTLLRSTAREYLRRVKGNPQVRFDIVVVYDEGRQESPHITLFKNAFPIA